MKIAIVGAPGSGKTFIAAYISNYLSIKHIECDKYFWSGINLQERVQEDIKEEDWIVEGHITKVGEEVLPAADKIIVIEDLKIRSLFRAVKRDWMRPHKAFYNIQFYDRMKKMREELIEELRKTRNEDILVLDNFPDLSESKLAAFCEDLKASVMKPGKPSIER